MTKKPIKYSKNNITASLIETKGALLLYPCNTKKNGNRNILVTLNNPLNLYLKFISTH